ncbi:MAG TPA: response regulator [Caulobacteraceae bacterium]|nr:response regulator [Caulobacteraceae bacterium]
MPQAALIETLLVDDQRAMRSLVRDSLHEIGFRKIIECQDGREALASLHVRPTHLVISDLNMPVMDGLELLRAMRGEPNLSGVAFIMLTSRGEADMVKEAIALGVNNYLVKPFTLATLRRKIEAVFGPLT